MILKIASLIFIITISLLPAQDYSWNISLANGDTLFSVSLQYFTGDYLLTTTGAKTYWISVNSIIKMTKLKESKVGNRMGFGILAGGVTGALIGFAVYEKPKGGLDLGPGVNAVAGGIVGGILGMAIGGAMGVTAGRDEVYDLSQSTYEEKVNLIKSKIWK